MRILFVEPFGRHEGHPSIESKRVIDAIIEAGVHITMVTFDGVIGEWVEISKVERHLSVTAKWRCLSSSLRFIARLKRPLPNRVVINAMETMLTMLLALRENRKHKYDAIHFFDGIPVFSPPLMAALFTRNQKFVVNIYFHSLGTETKDWFKNLVKALRKNDYEYCIRLVILRLVEMKVLKLLQRPIYNSGLKKNYLSFICHTRELKETYKDHLRGMFYDKINVIPLGRKSPEPNRVSLKQARQYLGLPQEAKIFLCFGTNHLGKNYEVIFQAVKDMPKTFYLLFGGRHVESSNKRNAILLAQKYDWTANTVVIEQFIPEAEKPYYFYASDAIILSYISNFIESASILNDSCQFQLPVIASDAGQLGEYVRNYNLGITFTPEDSQSLHQAIISFLNFAGEETLAIKANFHRFAAELSWSDVASRYIALYSRKI